MNLVEMNCHSVKNLNFVFVVLACVHFCSCFTAGIVADDRGVLKSKLAGDDHSPLVEGTNRSADVGTSEAKSVSDQLTKHEEPNTKLHTEVKGDRDDLKKSEEKEDSRSGNEVGSLVEGSNQKTDDSSVGKIYVKNSSGDANLYKEERTVEQGKIKTDLEADKAIVKNDDAVRKSLNDDEEKDSPGADEPVAEDQTVSEENPDAEAEVLPKSLESSSSEPLSSSDAQYQLDTTTESMKTNNSNPHEPSTTLMTVLYVFVLGSCYYL